MTDAKQAAANAALYAAIVDHAPEAVIVSTPGGEIVFINRAAEVLLGYPAAEVEGRNIAMLVPPQAGRRADAVKWLARWAGEPQHEQARYLDFTARRRDGHEMPVDVRVSQGQAAGEERFFITLRDNTQRRQELAAFKEANLRAQRILLVAEDAIVSCDAALNITFFNLKAETMFGYVIDEVLGRPLEILLPVASRPAHAGLIRAFGRGIAPSRMMSERQAVEGLRSSGEVFPIEAAITKVSVGGATTFTAHLRDITARKAAQARIEESERRLRAVFDHARDAIALLAPDGAVLEINRSARTLTEDSGAGGAGALVGVALWDLPWLGAADAGVDAEGRARLRAAIAEAAKGRTVSYIAELGEGADLRRIDLRLTPIADERGQVIYILPEGREIEG
jgi:PAS domain S-box-containing protein